eukprot:scaffold23205_cov75-Skeletonema_dohrnii-CCMP3373.AAC.1
MQRASFMYISLRWQTSFLQHGATRLVNRTRRACPRRLKMLVERSQFSYIETNGVFSDNHSSSFDDEQDAQN